MIRLELYSNAASSEQGLRHHPALEDLAETFQVWDLEIRFIRQSFREEEEINIASSRHAKGVTVRSRAVREMSPESHIKGCLAWMRAVVARPDRGLHLELENIRAPNGAPMVFAQILARKQKVFVSGLKTNEFKRMTARPDLTCREIPDTIRRNKGLKEEYLARASRPTSFFSVIEKIVQLQLAGKETHGQLRGLLKTRKGEALKTLSEAQVINLGLIHEYVERYEGLIHHWAAMIQAEQILGDLPQMFELFTQGIPYKQLRAAFSEFALEEKRERISGKRGLVNELRIGLGRAEEGARAKFLNRFTRMVVLSRIRQDPKLYEMAVRLFSMDRQAIEALALPRQLFAQWLREGGGGRKGLGDEGDEVPAPAKVGLFELAVNLVFQSKFTEKSSEGSLPLPVQVARNLVNCFTFDRFDIRTIYKLHPNLPARGVATNLADKVPITVGEMERIKSTLVGVLFPMGNLAVEISAFIGARNRDQEDLKRAKEISAYTLGALSQLNTQHYVVGQGGQSPLMRQGMLGAGRMLGLEMIESRDQIRSGDAQQPAEVPMGGYQLLMGDEESRVFPLQAAPTHLGAAYRNLIAGAVEGGVRRFISKKLKYLFDLHGGELFDVIHDHLTWEYRLPLSKPQLAALLRSQEVFDLARLREFGYRDSTGEDGDGGPGAEGENPWLKGLLENDEKTLETLFGSGRAQAESSKNIAAFEQVIASYGPPSQANPEQGPRPLAMVLAGLAAGNRFDLHHEESREALQHCAEAEVLSRVLQGLVEPKASRFADALESGEALSVHLPGPMAYLSLLRSSHTVEVGEQTLLVRLKPARQLNPERLDPISREIGGELSQALKQGGAAGELREALVCLRNHGVAWNRLMHWAALPLIDQMLSETVLKLVRPNPPLPVDLKSIPEAQVLCLGASSSDQAKFSRIVAHPEHRDVFATLSEMMHWLLGFQRLGEELAYFHEICADIQEIIAGFNLSAFDAPHITQYARAMKELGQLLALSPETTTQEDLAAIETQARTIAKMIREYYTLERSVGLRDRWMGRISMRLREMHPRLRPTFVDVLFERKATSAPPVDQDRPPPEKGNGAVRGEGEAYQTFSERVRRVVENRERLERKQVIVISPAHTQKRLALNLIAHLQRFKGMQTPIFIDISLCQAYLDDLRSRIPPYRLFTLGEL